MKKAEFLTELETQMKDISQLEKERIMNYYNETIEDAMEDGVSEEDVIASFGSMEDIMKQIHTDHVGTTSSPLDDKDKKPYLRYTLLFFTSPFWLTAIALIVVLYLVYFVLILANGCLVLAFIIFFLIGCFNLASVLLANMPSGLVLLGCMLVCLGSLPWVYSFLKQNIRTFKSLYYRGIEKGKDYWRKAVA